MAGEEITGDDLVNYVSGQILSGPEDAIWDDIFDWIANAIDTIVGNITSWWNETVLPWFSKIWSWITGAVDSVLTWFLSVWRWLQDLGSDIWGWITTEVGKVWTWIVDEATRLGDLIWGWIQDVWGDITSLFSTWGYNIVKWFSTLQNNIVNLPIYLWEQIQAGWDWLTEWMTEHIVKPITSWWDQFLGRLFDFGAWIGDFLEAVWNWVNRDVPGKSPWWEDVLSTILDKIFSVLFYYSRQIDPIIVHVLSTTAIEVLKPIGEVFNSIAELFLDAVDGFVAKLGQTNPDIAGDNARSLGAVGMIALAGLAGMTLASSWLKPLGGAGMGQIAAMIYDMTNYKLITGAAIGALTVAAIKQPLTYHYNEIFRPWLLSQRDFMELMAREAFTYPEKLRVPELNETVAALPYGGGVGYEKRMVGFYGYPDFYYGFFKELSFAPLRYFPLAGIARVGFWDEAWFTEALSRSGYSPTAREALMGMYREMVLTARQAPAMYQLRRLSREGFATMDEIKDHLEKVAKLETLTECRLYAMELEQEFARKEMAFDIIMGAFSRHITLEDETRSGLAGLGVPGDLLDLHLLREKLGLARRVTIPAEAAAPPLIGVEE